MSAKADVADVAVPYMITIDTDGDVRRYQLPPCVVDVALVLFAGDSIHAGFHLARALTADDLHTVERIALNVGHDEAVAFARRHLVEPARQAA